MHSFLLAALLSGTFLAAQAAPPGYRPPRHYYTPRKQPYRRPPVRLVVGANTTYYNGDVTDRVADNTFRVGLGLGLTQSLSPHFTFGMDLAYVKMQAKDEFPGRGFRFDGTSGLLTAFARYNLLADKSMYIGPNYRTTPVQVFLQAGVGAMTYDPTPSQVTSDGTFPLRPEQTGGFGGVAAVLPVGGGITLRASRAVAFTFEGLYYFTSTDLLDGISQRANPNSVDSFITGAVKLEYSFYKKKGKPLVHFD